MAYLALYRKYRPRTFDDVISQEHITTTLKNQLINGQSSHAYLFTGSRGTGKTTCAKILAKALNCTNLQNGNPCLECDSCKSIDDDYSDITEIDAASNNSVDDMRDLKEECFYAPMSGKYKVYIIDEVHMLTMNAFNALLKIIEEPPEHVVFILATTEVHKVPVTILSRCQRFEFRRIDINDSKKRLLWVAEQEGRVLTDDAAFLISKVSEGGMRDALSLLDKCFSVDGDVTVDVVRECAGISGSDYLFRIADLINERNTRELLLTLDELIAKSKDVTRLCEELISHYRSLMLIKSGADALAVRAASDDFAKLSGQCGKYPLEQIMRCISILSETFTSMGKVRNPSLMLEMCFIRLCTPSLDTDEKALLARIGKLEQTLSSAINNGISAARNEMPQTFETAINTENEASAQDSSFAVNVPESQAAPITAKSKPAKPADDLKTAVFGSTEENVPPPPPPQQEPNREIPVIYENADINELSPLDIWREIISTLPEHIQYNIENTEAFINNNTVYIKGGGLAVQMAVQDYREQVQKAVSRALGRNIAIAALKNDESENKNENDKVRNFLDLAGSMGVTIKTK